MDDQYFSSRKFVFFKQYYPDNSSTHQEYILEKELNGDSLINSIKRSAGERQPNIIAISEGVRKVISPELKSMAKCLDPRWKILYMVNSQLFYYDNGKTVLHVKNINVALLIAHLDELIMHRLFFSPSKASIKANTIVVLSCRDLTIECAIQLYEQGLDDSSIERFCDPEGEHRKDIRYILKMMRHIWRNRYRQIPTMNVKRGDEFLVEKVMEAGFVGDNYYIPYPDAKSSSKLFHHEVLYFIKEITYSYGEEI